MCNMAGTSNADNSDTRSTLHVLKKEDVHRICSGQSVVDLATAVKEMVENALDANATHIEVKLKDYGKRSIEVSDNGTGIALQNYETLALKHYTSKINAFEDIASISSFGFRGEALSSICQLVSTFTVCTRTVNETVGALLVYDASGKLMKKTTKARPVGTTILIEELFKPLPVRCKDFHRNIKKHYSKLLHVLQGYAVSCVNVKLSVTNTVSTSNSSKQQVVLSTQAHPSMGDHIASVFGTKFMRTLVPFNVNLNETWPSPAKLFSQDPDGEAEEKKEEETTSPEPVRRVMGYISKVGEGVGRSDNDRQYFFINSRPFDLPKLTRAMNEVWRQFEMKQKPACVLNFELPSNEFDVNVTPDKRETFLQHEALVIESFKAQLLKLYEPTRGIFPVQSLLDSFRTANRTEEKPTTPDSDVTKGGINGPEVDKNPSKDLQSQTQKAGPEILKIRDDLASSPPVRYLSPKQPNIQGDRELGNCTVTQASTGCSNIHTKNNCSSIHARSDTIRTPEIITSQRKRLRKPISDSPVDHTRAMEESSLLSLWSMEELRHQRQTYFAQEAERNQNQKQRHSRLEVPDLATAHASSDVDPTLAAAALQRVLKKRDFERMEIVGQFNLGFMIGKLDETDLFILDQHASDEKYNYERLQQTTLLHQQPLVRPLSLELTAQEEMVIIDHMDVFVRHGFTFHINKDARPTKRLQLLSLPFTRHTQFGVEDIRELASLLMDNTSISTEHVRLPKLMAMFASRACRSSIMIGTALHKDEMNKIVHNLASLDQPWNCPHGRPTLRHLLDLTQLDDDVSRSTR